MVSKISKFKISGHSTKREWAVYIFVATSNTNKTKRKLIYVGKTGDNRDGCNPVISRVGNHFSFNRIHSQIRNEISKIGKPENFDYEYSYAHFGKYNPETKIRDRNKTNELERKLNLLVQDYTKDRKDYKLLNVYLGKNVKRADRESRAKLINNSNIKVLEELIKASIVMNPNNGKNKTSV